MYTGVSFNVVFRLTPHNLLRFYVVDRLNYCSFFLFVHLQEDQSDALIKDLITIFKYTAASGKPVIELEAGVEY